MGVNLELNEKAEKRVFEEKKPAWETIWICKILGRE
jgi:hypothetical protein